MLGSGAEVSALRRRLGAALIALLTVSSAAFAQQNPPPLAPDQSLVARPPNTTTPITASQAQGAAQSMGTATLPAMQGLPTAPMQSNVMPPAFNQPTTNLQNYYQGGQGNTLAPGASGVANCMTANDPACQATQLMMTGKATRPAVPPGSLDAIIQNRNSILGNPEGVTQLPVSTYQDCKVSTRNVPATYTEEVCVEYALLTEVTCQTTLDVTVDPDYIYKCKRDIATQTPRTCKLTRDVDVGTDVLYSCSDTRQTSTTSSCSVYRNVTVNDVGKTCTVRTDVQRDYTCNTSPYTENFYNCDDTLNVTIVQTPTCTPGWVTVIPKGGATYWSAGVNKQVALELEYYCDPNQAGNLTIKWGAYIDGDLVGGNLARTVWVGSNVPPYAGSMGTVVAKYGIPINAYYETFGCPSPGQSCSVNVIWMTDLGQSSPPFPPVPGSVTCNGGDYLGSAIQVTDFWGNWVPGDPFQCYRRTNSDIYTGLMLVWEGGDWVLAAYDSVYAGAWDGRYSTRTTDTGSRSFGFTAAGYTQTTQDDWVTSCSSLAAAGNCRYSGSVCVETAGTRIINGVPVFRDCWKFRKTYQCVDPSGASTCGGYSANTNCRLATSQCTTYSSINGSCLGRLDTYQCVEPSYLSTCDQYSTNSACAQSSEVCASTGWNGACLSYDRQYNCKEVTSNTLDSTACNTYQDVNCRMTNEVCGDGPSQRVINGLPVTECWRYDRQYQCLQAAAPGQDYCAQLQQAGCTQRTYTCAEMGFNNVCTRYEGTSQCIDKPDMTGPGIQVISSQLVILRDQIINECTSNEIDPKCQQVQEICVQPGGTRNIEGLDVTKDCWQWERTYQCIAGNPVDYCVPLANRGCIDLGFVCEQTAWDGSCLSGSHKYRCEDPVGDPLPPNVSLDEIVYDILAENENTSACLQYAQNADCQLLSRVCSDATPATRVINGLPVTRDCWGWTYSYTCVGGMYDECQALKNDPKCAQQSESCVETAPSGSCTQRERVFRCETKAASVETINTCSSCPPGDPTCAGSTGTENAADFSEVGAHLEMGRELGGYMDPNTFEIFKGEGSRCSRRLGGLIDCCKVRTAVTSAANSDSGMATYVQYGAQQVLRTGSRYVYDALYDYFFWLYYAGAADLASSLSSSYYNSQFSFYGITYSPGVGFAFDPYSLAIAVAIQVLSQYLQCPTNEQILGMRRGQGLCTYVGSWRSSCFLGVCLTRNEGHCCYNSRLARMVNEQARTQLGRSYGDPRNPNCGGLTLADVAVIDWSRIDLTEFTAEIQAQVLDQANILGRTVTNIGNTIGSGSGAVVGASAPK